MTETKMPAAVRKQMAKEEIRRIEKHIAKMESLIASGKGENGIEDTVAEAKDYIVTLRAVLAE